MNCCVAKAGLLQADCPRVGDVTLQIDRRHFEKSSERRGWFPAVCQTAGINAAARSRRFSKHLTLFQGIPVISLNAKAGPCLHVLPLMAAFVAFLWGVEAQAQLVPGRGGLTLLAAHPAIQQELGVDVAGQRKLTLLAQDFIRDMGAEIQANGLGAEAARQLEQLGTDERATKLAEMRMKIMSIGRAMDEKFRPRIEALLSSEQIERLKQIRLQSGGSLALEEREAADALELNKDQRDRIAAINKEFIKKESVVAASGFAPGGDPQDVMKKFDDLARQRNGFVVDVLTREQRVKLDKLKGQPFDLTRLQPSGRPQ